MVEGWGNNDKARVVFMIKLYMESINGLESQETVARRLDVTPANLKKDEYLREATVIDEPLLRLQYMQGLHNVVTSKFRVDRDLALQLACYQFLVKFGSYDEEKHPVGFLNNRIVEFIPLHLFRQQRKDKWEADLYESLNQLEVEEGVDLMSLYLKEIYSLGNNVANSTFFRCRQFHYPELSEEAFIGICQRVLLSF